MTGGLLISAYLALLLVAANSSCTQHYGKANVITVSSPALIEGGKIPSKYTCKGVDVSPPLELSGIPQGTVSVALVMDDPDASGSTWVHWIAWNIDPGSALSEGTLPDDAIEGTNSWSKIGYGGPCPPSGTHRYFFKIYALDKELDLEPGSSKQQLLDAMEGSVIGRGQTVGLYSKDFP
jgi:hypothetical protein